MGSFADGRQVHPFGILTFFSVVRRSPEFRFREGIVMNYMYFS